MRRIYEHKNKLVKGFTQQYKVERLVYYEAWSRKKKNDLLNMSSLFCPDEKAEKEMIDALESVKTESNHAGGTLGGISTGMPLMGRVAFKPTSRIKKPQNTVDLDGKKQIFQLPEGSRHDLCVGAHC